MKKYLPALSIIICGLLTAVCFFKILDLENQVIALKQSNESNFASLHGKITSISANVQHELEQQSNLLSDSNYTYGTLDFKQRTVPLTCTVTPKSYSAKETIAILNVDNEQYPMKLQDGIFTATFDIPLFATASVNHVEFQTGETISTQSLDWYLSPAEEFLSDVNASFSGSSTSNRSNGICTKIYDGYVDIHMSQHTPDTIIQSLRLVETLDGKIIKTTDIPHDNIFEEITPETIDAMNTSAKYSDNFMFNLNTHKVKIPYGSTYEMYLEAVASNNLQYRCIVDCETIGSNGEPAKKAEYLFDHTSIYDENGKLLYAPEYKEID